MGRGKATVLLILGTIGLLVTGWLIASPIKHNGYTCGSVVAKETPEAPSYGDAEEIMAAVGAKMHCDSAYSSRLTWAFMVGLIAAGALALGAWGLNQPGPPADAGDSSDGLTQRPSTSSNLLDLLPSRALARDRAHPTRQREPMTDSRQPQPSPSRRSPRAKPSRHAEDPLERIEWQLDQIRVHTLIVALFFVLVLVGAVMTSSAYK